MDSRFGDLYELIHGVNVTDQMGLSSSCQDPFLKLEDLNLNPNLAAHPSPNFYSNGTTVGDQHDDYDFGDVVLNYISQMLMEEDEDQDKIRAIEDSSSLEATEKSLYEAIGQEYSPRQDHGGVASTSLVVNSPDETRGSSDSVSSFSQNKLGHLSIYRPVETLSSPTSSLSSPGSAHGRYTPTNYQSQLSFNFASNSSGSAIDGQVEASLSCLQVPTSVFNNGSPMIQFNKGLEETNKFLQDISAHIGLDSNIRFNQSARGAATKLQPYGNLDFGIGRNGLSNWNKNVVGQIEKQCSVADSRGRKHRHPYDEAIMLEQARGNKQSAPSEETVVRSEMFDKILLCSEGAEGEAALRETLQKGLNKNVQPTPPKVSSVGVTARGGNRRGRKPRGNQDIVDLRSFLTLCAQAVSANDHRAAIELLKKIRQHSSPKGDGFQRLAHYFANGLEARMARAGTPVHTFIVTGTVSAADLLRAYQLFLVTCPFKKLGNSFSNRTIVNTIGKAKKVHIIDYGIVFGYQWPCLIQRLSKREEGPPMLRITGIDQPTPGFRPVKRIEEVGRRLTNYAESFHVPFEFNAIAKKWETVKKEDLKLQEDEVLIVNCMFRLKALPDETVAVESPRNIALKLIRDIKPSIFIHGIANGSFSAPFFLTRFREALFHFSTLFDILEATAPRDLEERTIFEREIFGRQAMNVIACEGAERVERPETYKQWQVRNERIGFKQLPLDREIVEMAKERVRACYHKDFVIDEDGQWLLQGWKGRIVYALTCWKPDL